MQVLSAVFHSVLEVIEVKPAFRMSRQVYCVLITINIFQISGYIFCTGYPKPFLDEKWKTLARVNEVAPGTFLLLMKGDDPLTCVFFVLIELTIYSYYGYLLVLSYLKTKRKEIYNRHQSLFNRINQSLIVFFTLYYWIFLTPFTEISLGMLSCNQFAFLSEFRDQNNCDVKPLQWRILGIAGVILSVITNLTILFFFRNYQFAESNLLKRKFALLQIPICLAFFSLQFFYYIKDYFPELKFICAQIMGISMVFDILISYPFRDKIIASFYILGVAFFWVSHSIMTFWLNVQEYDGAQLFYTFWFLVSFVTFFLIAAQNYQYNNLLAFGHHSNYKALLYRVDFYLEEMLRFAINSEKDEQHSFKILELVVYHINVCNDLHCVCKYKEFKDPSTKQIDQKFILELIECILKATLKEKAIYSSRDDREHLFLKYITFLANFTTNPVRAYYTLQVYNSEQNGTGSSTAYFRVISSVLSDSFQQLIVAHQLTTYFSDSASKSSSSSNNSSKLHGTASMPSKLSLEALKQTDNIRDGAIPLLQQFIEQKVVFWNTVKEGFQTMEEFAALALRFAERTSKIKKEFLKLIRINNYEYIIHSNPVLIKIISMYKYLVSAELSKARQLQQQFSELKLRDAEKISNNILDSISLTNGSVQCIQASLSSADPGKIIKPLSKGCGELFGYADVSTIYNVKQLMPGYLASSHDAFISQYLSRGHSVLLQRAHESFGMDCDGYLFSMQIDLSSLFGMGDAFCMNAHVQKLLQVDRDYMIVSAKGQTMNITKSLLDTLFFNFISAQDVTKQLGQMRQTFRLSVELCNDVYVFVFEGAERAAKTLIKERFHESERISVYPKASQDSH